jgi:small GTP-binding protein
MAQIGNVRKSVLIINRSTILIFPNLPFALGLLSAADAKRLNVNSPRYFRQVYSLLEEFESCVRVSPSAPPSDRRPTRKLIVLGKAGVGKTTLVHQFTHRRFFEQFPNVGIDFWSIAVEVTDPSKLPPNAPDSLKLQVWDTAGQEKFRELQWTYFRRSDAAALVFSIDDESSFFTVRRHADLVQHYSEGCHLVLVGNKSDLAASSRKVSRIDALRLAAELQCKYVECSSKEGTNVDLVFEHLATKILLNWKEPQAPAPVIPANNPAQQEGIFRRVFDWLTRWLQ